MNNWVWRMGDSMPSFQNKVHCVAFSPDGRYLATASAEGFARVWKVPSCDEMPKMKRTGGRVRFDRQGRLLVSSNQDQSLTIVSVPSGVEVARFGFEIPVFDIFVTPGGEILVKAENDLWQVDESAGRVSRVFRHDDRLEDVAIAPDGPYVATGGVDRTARVWSLASGEEILRLHYDSSVKGVEFGRDGRVLAVITADNHLHVVLWKSNDLLNEAKAYLTRNLAIEEWKRFLGDEPYRKIFLNLV